MEEKKKASVSDIKKPEKKDVALPAKRKLSFKEKKELEEIEKKINILTKEKSELEDFMNNGCSDYEKLTEASERYKKISDELDSIEIRWLELSEIE